MKKTFFITLLTLLISGGLLSQNYRNKVILTGWKHRNLNINNKEYLINSFELGIGLSQANKYADEAFGSFMGSKPISITKTWYYYYPFISTDIIVPSRGDGAPNFMLNLGLEGGAGMWVFFLPAGLKTSVSLNTDFKDAYFSYGIGYDCYGFTVGTGERINLTKNNDSYYKSEPYFELKYTWKIFRSRYYSLMRRLDKLIEDEK